MSVKSKSKARRWRTLGLGGILILLLLPPSPVCQLMPATYKVTALPEAPMTAQEDASATLTEAGYALAAPPAWAGAGPAWHAPGVYRLFFVASSLAGSTDVYTAEVYVNSQGHMTRVWRVTRMTDTPAGDETALVLDGDWLAFATHVAGRCQSVTCIPLDNLQRRIVFAFDYPAEQVKLRWQLTNQGPRLVVMVNRPAEETTAVLDPAGHSVEPGDAGLRYMPVVRGEQAWLPNLVSRVRELPGVGPEKIAFAENLFFTLQDKVTRWLRGPAPSVTEQPVIASSSPEASATASLPQETQTASPTLPAPVAPTPLLPTVTLTPVSIVETRVPTARPTLPATAAPTQARRPTSTHAPAPTAAPVSLRLPDGIVRRVSVKPDPQRPYAEVELIELDPGLLQINMVPGTWEPRPTTGLVGSGVIPQRDWPNLVAAFNGGFAAMHGHYGMMAERKVFLPAREGVATLATYEDGSLRMGTWGQDLNLTPDMVSYRQNCAPLIENGMIAAETGKLTLWGLSVSNEVYLYRSGLGVTADGRLIYAVGKPLSAYTLARAMQMAGVQYAMQLDVDEFHVVFITYDVEPGPPPKVEGRKLRSDMHGFDGFFLRPFQLDFFYLVRRPQRLANPVRFASETAASPPAQSAVEVLGLPGHLAFASNRDGNWEIYTLPAAQPSEIRRLTDHPADDLYPAWSPSGQQLAFTSRRDGNAEVYIVNLADGALRRVTHQPSEEWAPAWSPDGTRLAYQSDRNGQSDVYVSAPDGSGERRLTPWQGNNETPQWSPDGRLIVFDSDLDVAEPVHASINLYFMNADGSYPRRFFSNGESPAWSPDGKTVALTSRRTGHWQIFLVNTDGASLRQLTSGNYDALHPTWSPDGRWLAFAGNQEGHWELYLMPTAGGQPLQLTFGTADNSYPAWGP